ALFLKRGAAPVVTEVRRQSLLREVLDDLNRLAGRDARRTLTEQLYRRQVVEAVERIRSGREAHGRERSQGNHLSLVGAHIDIADVAGPLAKRRLGRHQDLPRASK